MFHAPRPVIGRAPETHWEIWRHAKSLSFWVTRSGSTSSDANVSALTALTKQRTQPNSRP